MIASSPTDLAAVLDSIVRSAAQLAEADFSTILQAEGDVLRVMASLTPDGDSCRGRRSRSAEVR